MESTRYSFALARFGRFLNLQEAELLVFDDEEIQLIANGKMIRSIPWALVECIELLHSLPSKFPLAGLLGSGIAGKNENCFYVTTGGETLELLLEQDAQYRKGNLKELLKMLYEKEINLKESFVSGGKTYLMESVH